MTEHLSIEVVERLHQQAMGAGDRGFIYNHILTCEPCRERVVDPSIEAIATETITDQLLLTREDESFHLDYLDYEIIEGYVDNKLDPLDRSTAEMHLEVCTDCMAEIADLRESLATMRAASASPHSERDSIKYALLQLTALTTIGRQLRQSAALLVLTFVVLLAVFVWLKSDGTIQDPNRDLREMAAVTPMATASPTPLPKMDTHPSPELRPSPNRPTERPHKPPARASEIVLALNDGPNQITLEKSGRLRGLEELPIESQQAVREVLLSQTIPKPDVLDELISALGTFRAPGTAEDSAKLVYPAGIVIIEDQPVFQWVTSKAARGYRVEIGDDRFRQAAISEDLPAGATTWIPPTPLKRGIVYTWVVRVIGDEAEASPMSSPRKFKILESEQAHELNRLKANTQSHLALGIFYAHEGITVAAQQEFELLVRENPRTAITQRILKIVQSWNQH